MPSILITGGAGFIGVNTAVHFAERGWEVAILDNLSRRGTEAAVLEPIEQWHRLQAAARPSLKQLLLASDARTEELVPARGGARRRPVVL